MDKDFNVNDIVVSANGMVGIVTGITWLNPVRQADQRRQALVEWVWNGKKVVIDSRADVTWVTSETILRLVESLGDPDG